MSRSKIFFLDVLSFYKCVYLFPLSFQCSRSSLVRSSQHRAHSVAGHECAFEFINYAQTLLHLHTLSPTPKHYSETRTSFTNERMQ